MKSLSKLIAAAFIASAIFVSNSAKAQTTPANAFRFGVGLESGIPLGVANAKTHFELGGTARLQYGLSNSVALTLTSGFYNLFGTNYPDGLTRPSLHMIPVKAGVKAFFAPNFYFGAEAGAAFVTNNGFVKLDLAPALGFANKSWDVGVRYESLTGQDFNYGIVGLRIAYGFPL